MTDAELIEALKEEARWLLGASLRHGSADAGISGTLADAAADRIEAQAAEVARLTALMDAAAQEWSPRYMAAVERAEAAEAEVARLREALETTLSSFQSFKFNNLGDFYDPASDADFFAARAALSGGQDKPAL